MKISKMLIVAAVMPLAAQSATKDKASAEKLSFSGELWTELEVDFTSNNSSLAVGMDRALLAGHYHFDDQWELDIAFKAAGGSDSGRVLADRASLTRSFEKGHLEFGYQYDKYIKWLDQDSGNRWLNQSLTEASSFRSYRYLGVSYKHNLSDGTLAFDLKNGNDDALSSGASDMSVLLSAAYRTSLNEALNAQAYFQFLTKDEDSSDSNSQNAAIGAGVAVAGSSKDFGFLGEIDFAKVQADGATATLGFGVTASYSYIPDSYFYGRFFSGNDGWKAATSTKNAFEVGIAKNYTEHVKGAFLAEFASLTNDTSSIAAKLRLAAHF